MPNFSVLMSVYANENPIFLKNCFDSIFNQILKPSEIILVKDGCLNEKLDEIILGFSNIHNNLKVFGYKKNKGLGFALNFGLKKCNNDIIIRCDSDDINDLNRFKLQVEFIEKNNFAIISSNIEEFNHNPGDLKRYRRVPEKNSDIQQFKFSRNPFNHMAVAFRKSIITNAGGYLDMPGYEDYYLWLRVLKNFQGFNIQKSTVNARVGNDMIGRRQGYEFMKKELKFQKTLYFDGLITKAQFFKNSFTRIIPRLFPKIILSTIYKLFLRQ